MTVYVNDIIALTVCKENLYLYKTELAELERFE